MDMKIELVAIPVTDVDRAMAVYMDQAGFSADHDYVLSPELRFVQLTPPGSACLIATGIGITEMAPGTQKGLQMVIYNADPARAELGSRGVECSDVDEQAWGRIVYFADPDGNTWSLRQMQPST